MKAVNNRLVLTAAKWMTYIVLALAGAMLNVGCAYTSMVKHLGDTHINVSQPRRVHVLEDGSIVAESSLMYIRPRDRNIDEYERYFVIPVSEISNTLHHTGSRRWATIALMRENTTMYPAALKGACPEGLKVPATSAIVATYTNRYAPPSLSPVTVPYESAGVRSLLEIHGCNSYLPTYQPPGYRVFSVLLYVPALALDIVTFPIQAAEWKMFEGGL